MCFGSGGGSAPTTPTPDPTPAPDPGVTAQAGEWNQRRRQQNQITDLMVPRAANEQGAGPTTALKKLMGA